MKSISNYNYDKFKNECLEFKLKYDNFSNNYNIDSHSIDLIEVIEENQEFCLKEGRKFIHKSELFFAFYTQSYIYANKIQK